MKKTKEIFEEIRMQIAANINSVQNEEINPFELGRELSILEKYVKSSREEISIFEKNEFNKYSKEELIEMKIKMSGGGYSYDYSHIKEWADKKKELSDIEDKAKTAFKQSLNNSTFFDNDTGEEIIPASGRGRKTSVSYG